MAPHSFIGYADCFSGISGDMFLGALIHAGLPADHLRIQLSRLKLSGYSLIIEERVINGIAAIKVNVHSSAAQDFRHLSSIMTLLQDSDLPDTVIQKSREIFTQLAQAEAKVHNIDIDHVHFHEVGAVDTIVDIVGAIIGLQFLGIERLIFSALPSPHGFVRCAHGVLPLPAPAVCELLQGIPCYGVDRDYELVTPTGASLVKVLAAEIGIMPPMIIRKTGYGAGSTIPTDGTPNLLRLIIGEQTHPAEEQEVEVIETNLDDWSPEGYPYLCEVLFERGALDVSLTPVHMKKGRPGFTLQIICAAAHSQILKETLFRETSTIGLRYRQEKRCTLPRQIVEVGTPWGVIAAKKVAGPDGETIHPEYEECRKIAKEHGIALQVVYDAVKKRLYKG